MVGILFKYIFSQYISTECVRLPWSFYSCWSQGGQHVLTMGWHALRRWAGSLGRDFDVIQTA